MLSSVLLALTAAQISVQVDNFTATGGVSEVVMRVTNNGSEAGRMIFIDCVFFTKGGKAIDIGKALISDLAPGEVTFEKAAIPTTQGVETASCHVKSVD